MIRPVRFFVRGEMVTDCEVCGGRFDLASGGGACAKCRKVLCPRHLHGSWTRRLMVDFGAAPVCVDCRRAGA